MKARDVIADALFEIDADTKEADSILSALEQAGFAIVPVEPTNAMLAACNDKEICYVADTLPDTAPALYWKAMLAAAKEGG